MGLNLVTDPDVLRVVEYMQASVPNNKLTGVARGISELAPILWGKEQSGPWDKVNTLLLTEEIGPTPATSAGHPSIQSGASESPLEPVHADGGSVPEGHFLR